MTNTLRATLVCLAGALFFYYAFFQMAMFNSLSQSLMASFQLQAPALGQLSGVYFLADALVLIPAGLLLDRFSPRFFMLIVMFACLCTTFCFAYTTSFSLALVSHGMAGIANAFAFLGSMQLAARWLKGRKLALGMGLIITIGMIAGVVAQTPFTLLILAVGWRHAVMMNGLLGVLIFLFMWVALRDRQHYVKQHLALLPPTLRVRDQLKLVLLKKQNWICGAYTMLMYLPIVILGELWGNMYLIQARGLQLSQAASVSSMIFLGMMAGAPVIGWLSDRLERRRLPMVLSALALLLTLSLIIYDPYLSLFALMLLFFLLGFFACGQVLSYPTIAESNASQLTGSALSIVAIILNLGSAFSQPLFGFLMHLAYPRAQVMMQYTQQDYKLAMMAMPLVVLIALLLSFKVRETYGQTVESGLLEVDEFTCENRS